MPDIQPNFYSVDPVTGQAFATFPGGIRIPAADGSAGLVIPPDDRRVSWRRTDNGALVSDMIAWDGEGLPVGMGISRWRTVPPTYNPAGDTGPRAQIEMTTSDNGPASVSIMAADTVDTAAGTILDSDGRSIFTTRYLLSFPSPTAFPLSLHQLIQPWNPGSYVHIRLTVHGQLTFTASGLIFLQPVAALSSYSSNWVQHFAYYDGAAAQHTVTVSGNVAAIAGMYCLASAFIAAGTCGIMGTVDIPVSRPDLVTSAFVVSDQSVNGNRQGRAEVSSQWNGANANLDQLKLVSGGTAMTFTGTMLAEILSN